MSTPPVSASFFRSRFALLVVSTLSSAALAFSAEEPWKDLQEQNRLLRVQLATQQRQLDQLSAQIDRLANGPTPLAAAEPAREGPDLRRDATDRKLVISGEVGLAFFAASNDGQYRNSEFRVDDANLHLEASVARNTYLFGELQFAKREALDEAFHLGEFYVEFEDVSGLLGGPERLVNVRLGRVDIPFGEEYQHRDPLANPLITHSLSDIWGTDEGLELYGEIGRASYTFAVQNGSSKTMRDYNSDKSVTLRAGYDVTSKLRFSASAMRTGKLDSAREPLSEIWLGNNVFRNIGSAASTVHQGELAQLDASYAWHRGRVSAAGGRARYRDNDPLADNTQKFSYYQIEGVQTLVGKFYGAARFSTLKVDGGYPLAGIGNFDKYFLTSLKTKELQRLSLGGGYRFSPSLVLKVDYTFENGELDNGTDRDNRQFSAQAAIGF